MPGGRPALPGCKVRFRVEISPVIPWLRRIGLPSSAPVADLVAGPSGSASSLAAAAGVVVAAAGADAVVAGGGPVAAAVRRQQGPLYVLPVSPPGPAAAPASSWLRSFLSRLPGPFGHR